MKRPLPAPLIAACVLAAATIGSAAGGTPSFIRVFCGMLMVFAIPGFALMSAVRPANDLSRAERLLASVGLSLAISIGAAVLLAALPIGLTRISIAVLLGGLTIVFSAIAAARLASGAVRSDAKAPGS